MIKILIVDDSKTETLLLKSFFEAEEDMKVIGTAQNGKEAVSLTALLKPDIITMDLHMPIIDGFEATRLIMSQHPTPIVIISSRVDDKALNTTFKALAAGALSVLDKPVQPQSDSFQAIKKRIIETVRSMAEIKVIKRRFKTESVAKIALTKPCAENLSLQAFEIVAIGCSVGGPQALKVILSKLPAHFPVPIVIVQHMSQGFIQGFAHWLDNKIALAVKTAEDYETLRPGTVYFAPDKTHLEIKRNNDGLYASLTKGLPVSGFCPSATVLLQSVARCSNKNAVGILLTGMGNDGALGLLELKKAQGHTFIQDPDSAVVFGMAGVARSLGAADKVVELDKIADYLSKLTLVSNTLVGS